MDNYSVVSKGEYKHKQTSEHLQVVRSLVVRNKQKRYLLLDLENKNAEKLTGLRLQIDQYDGRGNFLGVKNVEFKDLSKANGRFILKERIDVHHACVDFFVKVAYAEYGDYKYCLDKNGTYAVYDKKVTRQKVSKTVIEQNVGKEGHRANPRTFSSPLFVRVLSVLVMLAIIGVSAWQVVKFAKDKDSFFLDNVVYEFVENDEEKELVVVGFKGFGGGKLVINDNLGGYPVTSVRSGAFRDNAGVKSVTINGNVFIESGAFSGCENLKRVELNGVTNIGVQAFRDCTSLKTVEINECEVIGVQAFKGCTSIEDLTIYSKLSDKVLTLGEWAFANCGNMGNVKIDQFVQMGEYVDFFNGVKGVESLYLKNYNYAPNEVDPENVNKGINRLFGVNGEVALKNLTIKYADTIPYEFVNGVSNTLESITIENLNTTIIGASAFKNCEKLHTFNVSTEITEVQESAFENTAITSFNASDLITMGKYAFSGCSSLSSFNLADNTTLTTIPEGAFSGTGNLNLVIPVNVTEIHSGAFENSKIRAVTFAAGSQITVMPNRVFSNCKSLREITLPQTVTTIGDRAFADCERLSAVFMSSGLETIGVSAFENCTSLSSVDIPTSVKSIGATAFKFDTALTTLVIPNSVISIGASVIEDCSSLERITVPFLGNSVGSGSTLGYLFAGHNYSVPATLKSIKITLDTVVGSNAFEYCENLTEIDISNQTQLIRDRAFANCYNIKYFVIPETVQAISSNAFDCCYRLFEIENYSQVSVIKGEGIATYALAVYSPTSAKLQTYLNNGYKFLRSEGTWYLTEIPNSENLTLPQATSIVSSYQIPTNFFYRVSAEQVSFGKSVTVVGDRAFAETDIRKVVITDGNPNFGQETFAYNNCLSEVDASKSYIANIPERTFINNGALTKVTLPNTVTNIGDNAFNGCSSLSEINVPKQLQTVGQTAFAYCMSLQSFDATNSGAFVTVGDYAFDYCSSLKKVVLPNSITNIGKGILRNCNHIEQITVPFLGENIDSNERLTYLTDGGTTYLLKYVKLTRSQKICDYAFVDWNGLVEVSLPNTVTEIGNYAFNSCYYLEKVNTPISLKTIGNYAFYNCGALKSFDFKNVSTIEAWAFANCASFDNITLPSSLTTMGERAFSGCSGAQTVTIGGGLTDIPYCAFEGCGVKTLRLGSETKNIGEYAFANCNNLQDILFTNSLENIGHGAFMQCNSLKNVELPASLKTLGEYAFANCYSLETVKIGNGLETISNYAFYNSSVKDLTLGSNVKTVGANAFDACYNLETVRLNSALRYIEAYAFSSTPIKSLDLPSSLLNVYDSAFAYCSNLEEVTVRSSNVSFSSTAFYDCYSIYHVYDLANIGITRKSEEHGGVARNAILVSKSSSVPKLQKATIDNIEYVYGSGVCGIVRINDYRDNLRLDAVTINNVTYNTVYVLSYASQGYDISKLTITNAVKDIYKYAFQNSIWMLIFEGAQLTVNPYSFSYVSCVITDESLGGLSQNAFGYYSYVTVYYNGSEEQWQYSDNRNNYYSGYTPSYFYSECFHEYENKWTYDEYGNITTYPQDYYYRQLKEPTCTEKGIDEEYCDICKHSCKYETGPYGHYFYDYICERCGEIEPVTVDRSNLSIVNRSLLTFTQGEGTMQMFAKTDSQSVKFADTVLESKNTFTIQAKVDLTVSFNCDFSSNDIGTLSMKKGDDVIMLENDKINVTYVLKAGETITFEFTRNDVEKTNAYVKLQQFSII